MCRNNKYNMLEPDNGHKRYRTAQAGVKFLKKKGMSCLDIVMCLKLGNEFIEKEVVTKLLLGAGFGKKLVEKTVKQVFTPPMLPRDVVSWLATLRLPTIKKKQKDDKKKKRRKTSSSNRRRKKKKQHKKASSSKRRRRTTKASKQSSKK